MSERAVRTAAKKRRPTTASRITAVDGTEARDRPDRLVTEEPMEIRVRSAGRDAQPLAVTMRTPGNDFELAAGFCVTEGIVSDAGDVAEVAYCLDVPQEQNYNVVTVALRTTFDSGAHERRLVANASCGPLRQGRARTARGGMPAGRARAASGAVRPGRAARSAARRAGRLRDDRRPSRRRLLRP